MSSLQCVRAAAALLVVYFHAVLQILRFGVDPSGQAELTVTPFPLFGKCGVDIFFVLSGFLMWRTTAHGPQSVAAFYGKRTLRIVPLYWLVTGIAVCVALVAPGLLKSTRVEAGHVIASLLFLPWPNPASGHGTDLMTPIVVPGWTLNFEIVFYLLFGLTLPVPVRWRLVATLVLFGAFIAIVLAFGDRSQILAFYDPGLLLEFLAGVALGKALDRGAAMPSSWALILLPVSAVALCRFDAVPPDGGRLLVTKAPALCTLYAAASIDVAGRWPSMPLLTRIGDASFSLYLTHVFVLAALRTGFAFAGVSLSGPAAQTAFIAASLILSSLVALSVYRFVERPLGEALRRGRHSTAVRGGSASAGDPPSMLSAASTDLTSSSRVSGF